jgi:uncharacterized membrane protein YczE
VEPTLSADRAWTLAVRVAVASSLLMAALGAALARFAGVGTTPILALTAGIGLMVGLRLPAARPAILRRRTSAV